MSNSAIPPATVSGHVKMFHRLFRQIAGVVVLFMLLVTGNAQNEPPAFPADAGLVNVKDFGAKGDGLTDDTLAIQAALSKYPNGRVIIYLPDGVYRISDTLKWPEGRNGWEWKNIGLMGQSQARTILKLLPNCPGYGNIDKPKAMLWTGPAPEQRFGNNIRRLTVDVSAGNPGAIGIQFNASNTGTLREVTIRSKYEGAIGLDMGYANQVGPLLVKDLTVVGFRDGIYTANGLESQTFEHIRLQKQRRYGWLNQGQVVSIRDLISLNVVPAIRHEGGTLTLLDSVLTGNGKLPPRPAPLISSDDAKLFVRNLRTPNCSRAIDIYRKINQREMLVKSLPGPRINEFVAHSVLSLFPTKPVSLRLPIEETPAVAWEPPAKWINVQTYGAQPGDSGDDTEAIQKAIDSGGKTVYLPNNVETNYPVPRGGYVLKAPLHLRGNVERFIGCEASFSGDPYWEPTGIIIEEGTTPIVVIERIGLGKITNNSSRTVVIKDCTFDGYFGEGHGNVFFEDACGAPIRIKGQHVWARQLNPELVREAKTLYGPHIINDWGRLWVLGLKTEGGGTLLETKNGGSSEILGALWYTTFAPHDNKDPMFINEESNLTIVGSECNFGSATYPVYVKETRNGLTKTLTREALLPNYGSGMSLPLYVGYPVGVRPQKRQR